MTVQLSDGVRDAGLDAVESVAGTAVLFRILTGAQPADCSTAQSGTALVTLTLPTDWMSASSGGAKTKLGVWTGTAGADGTAGYFRIYDSTGTTCHMQGAVAVTASDLNLDNTSILTGQTITISTFTLNAGNA